MRQFIRKRLNSERMIDIGNGPEPTDPHVCRRRSIFRAKVCHGERRIRKAQPQFPRIGIVFAFLKRGTNRRKNGSLQPRRGLSIGSECRFHVHRRHGMIDVKLDIVFPAPDHLHGLSRFFREHCCFHREVRKRLPAESATQQRHVYRDIFLLQAHGLRDRVPRSLWIL